MNIKILFWVQGALLIVLGLWGIIDGEGAITGFGWEATSEALTQNKAFSLSQLVLGVIAMRIPSWVVNKLKEGSPSIWTRVRPGEDFIVIHTFGLKNGEDKIVGERIAEILSH